MPPAEPAGLPGGLVCRPLTAADITGALALSGQAGWNQIADDWVYMIGRGPGWACATATGEIVATALTLPYGNRFGWIGMVLVAAPWRRRGIAASLLRACIDSLLNLGLTPGLDATAAGRQVYLGLGFRDAYPLTRYRADRPEIAGEHGVDIPVHQMTGADLENIRHIDRRAFGADRHNLLHALLARAPAHGLLTGDGLAHGLARHGATATQLGPIVAGDVDHAIAVAAAGLATIPGPVLIDVADRHLSFRTWLESAGFRPQRRFMRMLHGRSEPFDDPARVFAIAGPELG